jgi:uncharacterized protein YgiM (DUF1202 family)
MNRKVNLLKYVKDTDGKWRFVPVNRSHNGAVEQDERKGSYYIEWREGGQRKRKAVGEDLEDALLAKDAFAQQLQPPAPGLAQILAALDLHMREATKSLKEAIQWVERNRETNKERKEERANMPTKVIQVSDIPVTRRQRRSVLRDSYEWIATMAKIQQGLKPNEAIQVTFPPTHWRK